MCGKKRVLFVCQYFYPEVFRGNDIAFRLAEEGHEVHVVAGIPNYPKGTFFPGYGIFMKRHEVVKGVHVTRLPIVPRGNGNKLMLALNYFSYMLVGSVWVLTHALLHKYDLVFCQLLSPITAVSPAVLYKKLRRVPLYTWVLDLWPESIEVAGGVHNRTILGFFDWFVKKIYKHSDKILTSSKSFYRHVARYGDYGGKIIYYPQWSDGAGTAEVPKDIALPDIPQGFRIMFAGAVGEAHNMECNMQAALLTRERKDIKWIIVGDGRRLKWVRYFVKEHHLEDTVYTLGGYPSETMPWFFAQADVMLVSLTASPLFDMYCPAKIASYMAASRPIIAALNGEGGDVVREAGCGWNLSSGDAEGLARLAIELSETNKEILTEKGKKALEYYKKNFDKETCLGRLDEILELK